MGLRIAACIGWLSVVAAPLLMGACSADVNGTNPANSAGGTSSSGGSAPTGGSSVTTQACTGGGALANARPWRLTDAQYVKAGRQGFGVTTGPEGTEAGSG